MPRLLRWTLRKSLPSRGPADAFAFVHRRRHLDLDDLRAPVGELANRRRAGANAGEIEDGEVRESVDAGMKTV
jgi:hypothetical protein